ncbi:hypothetical protein LINPERPRIM_LOCUS9190 [Linum perenne]
MVVVIVGPAVGEAGIGPPRQPLVLREVAGSLAFEEEDGFGECVGVVVVGGGGMCEEEEEGEQSGLHCGGGGGGGE